MSKRSRKTSLRWTVAQAMHHDSPSRRRWRRGFVVLAIIATVVAAERLGQSRDMPRYHRQLFWVVRVIDGDTLELDAPDGDKPTTRVRLWGIDAPERAKAWQGNHVGDPGSQEAYAALQYWTEGRAVTLELLPHRVRGKYGRLLAYVYNPAGQCANEQLLRDGWVSADSRWWHPKQETYELFEESARRQKRGLWR